MWCARSRSVSLRSRRAEVVRRRECSDVREMRPALLLLVWAGAVAACGPGRGFTRRRSMRRPHPLVYGQHEPNVSENIASGHPEGRITKNDTKFKDLVPNYNEDIFFKDEEGTGADRLMTQRCKEKLNTLAISVMNQWPGVRLRVIEGWEEEDKHSPDSLHYEGRAVDLTTSDRDYSKNGLLARLAAEAGFDWVYYESRSHIHCSVKTESSVGTGAGCFPEGAVVHTERGPLDIAALRPGDRVLASDEVGKVIYSEVLTFLDRKPNETRRFVELGTDIGKKITTTPSHLLLLAAADGFKELFAADVRIGDTLLTWYNSTVLKPARVTSFKWLTRKGAYAPLTAAGTIIVDDTLASCYALVRSQSLAHAAMAPLRWLAAWTRPAPAATATPAQAPAQADGVHWYARALYSTANYVLPSDYIYL